MIQYPSGFSFPTDAIDPLLQSDGYRISISVENTERLCYDRIYHRLTDEQYILDIAGDGDIRILCSGEKSAFYALCDLADRRRKDTLTPGTFECAPAFAVRGYIEGFYGRPWSPENRVKIMRLMAAHRMNTVYYAPKDDAYHRSRWREIYPEGSLEALRSFADEAKKHHMAFYYCIAPGLSIRYSSAADFAALLVKTKQLYSIGIRAFGLLLDDIDDTLPCAEDKEIFGDLANAHIDLINRYYAALCETDPGIRLTVCPTLYHGAGNEYYIAKLGQNIPAQVDLFWTGRDICSRELTVPEALRFIENTRHKPLYWDNYPVNDEAMYHEMHLGPVTGRDTALPRYAGGLIANCMEYAECSAIPLITVADYLWDSEHYAPQASYEAAIAEILGPANKEAFLVFADHLYTSCLQNENSPRTKALFYKLCAALAEGDNIKFQTLSEDYLSKLSACRELLRADLPICRELAKWTEKFEIACEILPRLIAYIQNDTDRSLYEQIDALIGVYNTYPAKLIADFDFREVLMGRYKTQ